MTTLPIQDRIDITIERNPLRRLALTAAAYARQPQALIADVAGEMADFGRFCRAFGRLLRMKARGLD